MKRQKRNNEITVTIKTSSATEFFARGRKVAALADNNLPIVPAKIISFEDPKDLIKFLTVARLALLAAIRRKPDSISKLAHKLHRSRSSVDKDVQLLEKIGIVESEYVINPGHGRCRVIKAIDAKPIKLQVEAFI